MLNENLVLDRWYIGIFLVRFGFWLSLGSRRLADLRTCLRSSERSGVAVLAGALRGTVGYAIGTCAFALSLGFAYLRVRNRSERRAAALEPRAWTPVVPAGWYPAAAVMALTPLGQLDLRVEHRPRCMRVKDLLCLLVRPCRVVRVYAASGCCTHPPAEFR